MPTDSGGEGTAMNFLARTAAGMLLALLATMAAAQDHALKIDHFVEAPDGGGRSGGKLGPGRCDAGA